jgi:hypothetical protein
MKQHIVLVLVAVVGFVAYGIGVESKWIWIYAPISLMFTGLVFAFNRKAEFSNGLLAALAVVIVGNLAGGVLEVRGDILYIFEVAGGVQYDKVFHAAATGVASWASWELLGTWGIGRGRFLAALMMGVGGGAFIEIFEFFGTKLLDTNVGGYDNNMLDLIANFTGSLVALLLLRYRKIGIVADEFVVE